MKMRRMYAMKSRTWQMYLVTLLIASMLAACAAPAAPTGDAPAADAPAAEVPAAEAAEAADLPEVPRNRTLILMSGPVGGHTLFDNHNPYIPGSDEGFHTGTLPASFE